MNDLILYLWEPFQYDFMQRALVAGLLGGLVCAILSCFLILKGWSLIGHAISHAVLPGIALIYVVGLPLSLGAFIAGIICAISTGYVADNSRVKEDTALGIVFSGMFALGIIIVSLIHSPLHLHHILFGNILGITQADYYQIIIISVLVLFVLIIKYKSFLMYCFDPVHTLTTGLSVTWIRYTILSLISLTIVSAMQSVGVILITAMLIIPGITGFIWVQDFNKMVIISIVSVIISVISGIIFSFYINGSTGACIVLIQSAIFFISFFISSWKGKTRKKKLLQQTL